MARKALFMQQHGKAAPTFADFVSAPIDVQYERRKSKRRAVNKLLMPKGSTQMGYASAALRAYQEKIYRFGRNTSGDPGSIDGSNGNMDGSVAENMIQIPQRIGTGASARPWNVPPTPFSLMPIGSRGGLLSRSFSTPSILPGGELDRETRRRKRRQKLRKLQHVPATPQGWRGDKRLNPDDTPSIEQDMMRILTSDELLQSYENEDKDFASLALYGEIKLREAFAGTRGMGIPNVQRTAICCHLLFKLNSQFGRYKDMHMIILIELMRSLYLHYDKLLEKHEKRSKDPWTVASILESTPFFELIDGLQAEVRKLRRSLNKLEQLRDDVELMAQKRNQVFQMAIRAWQMQVARRCFENWKASNRISKRQRSMLHRRRMQIWFSAWKKWLVQVKGLRTLDEKNRHEQESKQWAEVASDLKTRVLELEGEVSQLNNLLKKEKMKNEQAKAREVDLKFRLDDSQTRCKRLMGIVEQSVGKTIMDTKHRIGSIPGTEMGFGQDTAPPSPSSRKKKTSLPMWIFLQDIRKIGKQAMTQRDLDVYNANAGGVKRSEETFDEQLITTSTDISAEASTLAIEQLCKKDATSLIKAWVNYQINNPCSSQTFGADVDESQFAPASDAPQMRIDNFSSHLRDSVEYALLSSNILLQQPVIDRVGGYEVRVDAGEFRLPTPTKTKKKKQVEEQKAAALAAAEKAMRAQLRDIFDTMDSSSDGKLTQAELLQAIDENTALVEKLNAHPRLAPFLIPSLWEAAFKESDANTDGVITFDEFLEYSYGVKAGKGLSTQIYDLLDENKNEKVSRADILGAVSGIGSAQVTSLFQCHPDLSKIMDVELWEAQFEKAMQGELHATLSLANFQAWLDLVLQTQHEQDVHAEHARKEKEDKAKREADRKIEILLTRENFKDVVLGELDSGQRASRLLYGLRTWLGDSFPNVLLEAEEIHLADAEWNFTALASLFVNHATLQPDQLPFVTDFHNLHTLEKNWKKVTSAAKTTEDDPTIALETLSKRINNISNKVTQRISKLESGHQLWWRCARTVLSRLVNDLCRRARGIEGTVGADEIEREKGSFMKLSFMKIQQLLQEEDDARFAFEEITDYIGESFMELRKVYKAYGAMGGGGSTMSMAEFLMLVRDCKLIDKKFTSQDVDLVFIKTNIEIDEVTGERVEIAMNPNKALTTTEFVEAIVRVSHGFYKSRLKQPLITCIKRVMEDHIVPFAKRSDAEAFRKKLASPELRGVFQRHGDRLKLLFDKYSKADDSDIHEDRAGETMNIKEFMQLMKDKQLLGNKLPHKTVQQLFQNVQNDDAAFEEDDDDMDAEVDYDEFVESVAAVACIVYPNPYVAFEQRIERFILSYLLVGEKRESKKGTSKGSSKTSGKDKKKDKRKGSVGSPKSGQNSRKKKTTLRK